MTVTTPSRARWAVGATFLLRGTLVGTWVPHILLAKVKIRDRSRPVRHCPFPYLAIAAFVIAGLGIGNVAPVLFAGGGRLEPDAPVRGIAAVTTLGYSGFLCGPPLIGFAEQVTSLPTVLFLTVIAALIIAFYARPVNAADTY